MAAARHTPSVHQESQADPQVHEDHSRPEANRDKYLEYLLHKEAQEGRDHPGGQVAMEGQQDLKSLEAQEDLVGQAHQEAQKHHKGYPEAQGDHLHLEGPVDQQDPVVQEGQHHLEHLEHPVPQEERGHLEAHKDQHCLGYLVLQEGPGDQRDLQGSLEYHLVQEAQHHLEEMGRPQPSFKQYRIHRSHH